MHYRALTSHPKLVQAFGQEAELQALSEEQLGEEIAKIKSEVYKEAYGTIPPIKT